MSVAAALSTYLPVPSGRPMETRQSSPHIPQRDGSRSSGASSRSSSRSRGGGGGGVGHSRTRSDAPPRPPPRSSGARQAVIPARYALPRSHSPGGVSGRSASTPQPSSRPRTVSNDAVMPRSASTPSASSLSPRPVGSALPQLRQPSVRRPPIAFRAATTPALQSTATDTSSTAMAAGTSSNSSTSRGAPLAARRAHGSASKLPVISTGMPMPSSSSHSSSSRDAAQGRWRDVQWKQQLDALHPSSGDDAAQEMLRSTSPTTPAEAWVYAPKARRGSAPDSREDLLGAHAAAALSPARARGVLEAVALAPSQLRTSSDRSREPSTSSTVSRLRTISGDSGARNHASLDIPRRGTAEPTSPTSGTSALARLKAGLMSPKTLIPRSSSGPVRAAAASQAAAAAAAGADKHHGAIQSFVGAMMPSSMEQRRIRRRASQESVSAAQPRKSHARRSLSTAGFSFGAQPPRTATAKLVISEPTLLEQPFSVDPEMEAIKRSLDPNALGLSTAASKELRAVTASDEASTGSPAPSIVSSTSFPPGDPRSLWMANSAPRGPVASPRARPKKMHLESDQHLDELVGVSMKRRASETALRRPGPRPIQVTPYSPARDAGAEAQLLEPSTPTRYDSPDLAAKLRVRFAGGLMQGSFGAKSFDQPEGSSPQQPTPEHGSPASTLGSESLTASPATPAAARLRLGHSISSPRIVVPSLSSRLAHQRFDAGTKAERGDEDAKQQFLRRQPEDANALGLVISATSTDGSGASSERDSDGSPNSSYDATIVVRDAHASNDETIVMHDFGPASSTAAAAAEQGARSHAASHRQYEFEVLNGTRANETYILSHRESCEAAGRAAEWPMYVLSSVPGSEAGSPSLLEGPAAAAREAEEEADADAQSIVSTSTWGFMGGNYDADGELDASAANSPELPRHWPAAHEEQTSSSTLVDASLAAELLPEQLDIRVVHGEHGKPMRFELAWQALCSSNDGAHSQVVGGRSLLPAAVSEKLIAQLRAGLTAEHLASQAQSLTDDFYSASSTSLLSVDSALAHPRSATGVLSEMERQQLCASEQAERQARREWGFCAPHTRTCSYPTLPGPSLQRSSSTAQAPRAAAPAPGSPPRSPSFLPRPLLLAKSPLTARRSSEHDQAAKRQASAESLLLSASDSTSSSRAQSSGAASQLSARSAKGTPRPALPRLETGSAPRPPVSSPGGTLGYHSGQASRLYSTGTRSVLRRSSAAATPRRSPVSLAELTPRTAPRRSDSMESDLMDTRPPSEILALSSDSAHIYKAGSSLAAITGAGA